MGTSIEEAAEAIMFSRRYPDKGFVAELQEWYGDDWERYYNPRPMSEDYINVVSRILRNLGANDEQLHWLAKRLRDDRRAEWKQKHGANEALRRDNKMLRAKIAELERSAEQ